ncbi:MAG: signal peptidase II [Elusimicrobia bacterium]|nr:signal peptidase II [Elusimicrobiota bacterium]
MRATDRRLEAFAVAAIVAADRLTKVWAQVWLEPRGSVPVTPFFHLSYVENSGAAWGMLAGSNGLLAVLSLVLLGGLMWARRSWDPDNRWAHRGAVLVVGGALGNLYDRLAYGAVVDFLDFRVWPVFNVADSCITVGACALAWGLHLEDKRQATRSGCC